MKNKRAYYLGLDIGTDSVGYAVTDEHYHILKYKGEAMWGSHLFDPANQCADRRAFRTARRRLDRRQQRVRLVDEIFAPEVTRIDPHFYIRKKESALYPEDSTYRSEYRLYFNDPDYTDKEYHLEYPTIHHLLVDLIENKDKKFDIRLINIAIDWLVAHRGHFLSEVGTDHIDQVLDFGAIYESFLNYFENEGLDYPWDTIDSEKLGEILKMRGVNNKKNKLKEALYQGKIPASDNYFLDRKTLIDFLAGGKVKVSKLFPEMNMEPELSMNISDDPEGLLPQLGDMAEFVSRMIAMYDWSVLSDILGDSCYISQSKVKQYEQHKKDLKSLKQFVKKYAPESYNLIFKDSKSELSNYTAYVYNTKSVRSNEDLPKKKASAEDFYKFLKKTLKLDKLTCDDETDQAFLADMRERIDRGTFLPKQVNTDNRVIPYQLYYVELERILENAAQYYAFLSDRDKDGYTNTEKLRAIFRFRIPYYVGPLRTDNTSFGWMKRKAGEEGRIFPWNFGKIIDLDESEDAFINRMTNSCTYIPGADVLPKNSLLYMKYTVLNEINNIKVNEKPISVEAKQTIYKELFEKKAKVSTKQIHDCLIAHGWMEKEDVMGGLDITVKASLKSRYEFRNLLMQGVLNECDVEKIICRCTYTEEKDRYKKWLQNNYPQLNEADLKYVSRLKFKDFGRLSKEFLTEFEGADKETGEAGTIMHFLWHTNDNLMQLLSERYTFSESLMEMRQAYYAQNPKSLNAQMEELGISNAVKRPVTRTLDVVKDVVSAEGCAPIKIFVEMARGADEVKKRSVTRKDQILELYKNAQADTVELERQLEAMGDTANNQLQSDALFLYYMQLGKCMYSGEPIDITKLKSSTYNIDHIYPQSYVKDDSVMNNRVLVLSKINGEKKDVYPIDKEIRTKMHGFWKMLSDHGLITKEKYARLIRSTGFTEEEKMGFINRQLVETRQSMKAVTQLLKSRYPETEIVYVKARLAADFKKEFELTPKSRIINDLHHAKDAYLNIVVGNVYHERFTKKWFHVNAPYSLKTRTLFARDLVHGDQVIWNCQQDLPVVKATYEKNNIHLTRYAFCQKGGLFDQMPMKKGIGQVPLKSSAGYGQDKVMDIEKYGGYNKPSCAFFVIARYMRGNKREVSFVPVSLMYAERFLTDSDFAIQYVTDALQDINTKKITEVELPLGKRVVKYKSVLSLDGYKVWINGKASGGRQILASSAESLVLSRDFVSYIKSLENFIQKKSTNKSFLHDECYDGLTEKGNIEIYDMLIEKLQNGHFSKMPVNQGGLLVEKRDKFLTLDFENQVSVLLNAINLLKSGRAGGCNLTIIGGGSNCGGIKLSANLTAYSNTCVNIVDYSPAGLHIKKSINLLDLLK